MRHLVGDYRVVDLAPDALALLEPLQRFPLSLRDGVLRLAIPGGAALWLEPTPSPGDFVLHGGQGEGEIIRFREDTAGRMHAYASTLHLRERRWSERYRRIGGLALGVVAVGCGGLVFRWRRSATRPVQRLDRHA